MKNTALTRTNNLFLLCLSLLLGCTEIDPMISPRPLLIHLQSGFDQSQIAVTVNDITLLDRSISSNIITGFATSVTSIPDTSFNLEIRLKEPKQLVRRIVKPSKGQYIGIRLDDGKAIKICQQSTPFMYD